MNIVYDELCVSQNCKKIYLNKEHAILGISPFNSYFSEKNIILLVEWVSNNFGNFNIFVPDTLHQSTYNILSKNQGFIKVNIRENIEATHSEFFYSE